jgi:hypothetical protein
LLVNEGPSSNVSLVDDGPIAGEVITTDERAGHRPSGVASLGRRAFIVGAAAAGTALASATYSGTAHAVEPGAGSLVALDPRRLCDTRQGRGFSRAGANAIRVKVAGNGNVPANAIAAVLTVTAVNRRNAGNWVAALPAGSAFGGTSNLNCAYYDHRVANLVTVKLGTTGANRGWVEIRSLGPAEIIVDIAGVYVPATVPVKGTTFAFELPTQRAA